MGPMELDRRSLLQARQLSEIGAGVGFHHNSQRVLGRLGLGEHVGRVGTRLEEFRFYTPDGTVVSHETYAADAPPLGLRRADLVAILAGALPTGVLHTGHRCTQFTQNDGSATVSFDIGLSVETDVVIAADGIHSACNATSWIRPRQCSRAWSPIAA